MPAPKSTPLKYFLYARKSSESEDKQVASVSSQVEELTRLAKQNGYNVVEVFTEEKTAKCPGRPVFNRMLSELQAGKAGGILCWKLDRLARNPIDGGTVNWLLQQAVVKHIRTINKDYFPSDNVLMMNLEFGMANQFILDLSANTKRGQRSKVGNGWLPHKPPVGYLNNKHNLPELEPIYPDPYSFPLMRGLWDMLLKKRPTIEELFVKAKEIGLHKNNGGKIGRANFYRLFRNPFYCGEIYWDGELHPGKHKPMISRREFDMAQEIMDGRASRRAQIHEFAFTGMIRCGECGASITAEERTKHQKNGNSHHYAYYRCTRRGTKPCHQPPISVKEMEGQIMEVLGKISIPPLFAAWAIKQLKEENAQETIDREEVTRSYRQGLDNCTRKLSALLDMRLAGEIGAEVYAAKKNAIEAESRKFKELIEDAGGQFDSWLNRAEAAFNFATTAQERFKNGSLEDKRQILSCFGLNLSLKDRKLHIPVEKHFILFQEVRPILNRLQIPIEPVGFIGRLEAKLAKTEIWGRWLDRVRTCFAYA